MLTLKTIQEQKERVIERLNIRNFKAEELIEQISRLDVDRRNTQQNLDNTLAEANALSKQIGQLFKEGKAKEANHIKEKSAILKENAKSYQQKLSIFEHELNDLLVQIPNLPHESVPKGQTADDNELIRSGGQMPTLSSDAEPHWELAKKYDIIDFDMGTKLTGAGFPLYKGQGAKLQRALINFFLAEAEKQGFQEFMPPLMVNEDSGFGTGQLPDKEGQMYHVTIDNFYLVPTAEVPITNIFRDVILNANDFPVKCTAYSPCFRREAGSYGKDVRGLNRLHQFDKVEIVVVEHPEKSYQMLEEMVAYVETLVQKLELPYRIVKLCGGDMGFTSALTFDFEVFAAAQERWLEVSSVSNFEAYQANRLRLRFKERGEKKTQLAHTLNGSALALPRIVAALLENNQTNEGIRIPKALQTYTQFDFIR